MQKYECSMCGYIYDPAVGDEDGGVAPGTAFENAGSSCGRWYSLWIYVGMEILPLVESDWLDLPPR